MFQERSGDEKVNTIPKWRHKKNSGGLERGMVNGLGDLKLKCERQYSFLLRQGDQWDACKDCVEEVNKEFSTDEKALFAKSCIFKWDVVLVEATIPARSQWRGNYNLRKLKLKSCGNRMQCPENHQDYFSSHRNRFTMRRAPMVLLPGSINVEDTGGPGDPNFPKCAVMVRLEHCYLNMVECSLPLGPDCSWEEKIWTVQCYRDLESKKDR